MAKKKFVVTHDDPDLGRSRGYEALKYMKEKWVDNRRTGTYGELRDKAIKPKGEPVAPPGGSGVRHTLGAILDFIAHHKELKLPCINVLCCNSTTHRPGRYLYSRDEDAAWKREVDHVYQFDWSILEFA